MAMSPATDVKRVHVLHAIDGRLRIRVSAVKRDRTRAAEYCEAIRRIAGVRQAVPSLVTGSITITYDASKVNRAALCGALAPIVGDLHVPEAPAVVRGASTMLAHAGHQVMQVVLKSAMEAALKHAIFALL